jgi:hypothetical protein
MRLLYFGISLILLAVVMSAETVTLRDGSAISGTYLGGSPRQVKIEVGDRIETLDVEDIVRIEFDRDHNRPDSATSPVEANPILLPAGTNLVIRMIDGVDSERDSVGQTFTASLDEPVMIDGETAVPRGAGVVLKLVDDKESGKLAGKTTLTLDLMSVIVDGRMVDVNTDTVTEASSSRGARTGKLAGGTALFGTIIGAIAGGGKGAAIGLGAGAAAGVGAEIVTRGQHVSIPSETRLTFVLESAVRL